MSESNKTPVVATKRISYGPKAEDQILPLVVFSPADHGLDIAELRVLDAVQDCSEADAALHEAQTASAAPAKKAAAKPAPAAAPAEPDIG